MKLFLKICLFFVFLSSVISCNFLNNSSSKINSNSLLGEVSWLIGSWENTVPEGKTIEKWQKLNDSVLVGKSIFIKENDSLLLENIMIVQREEGLYYIPTVINQNEGNPVEFKLSYKSGRMLVFENPQHDFPQKISYSKISNDSILAEISGISNGKEKSVKFPMTRK